MATAMQCKVCGQIITEDIERVRDVKELQCPNPNCARIFANPYYEGE